MQINICNCTFGSDPELFIVNTKTNKIVSSIGLIPGEKNKPYTKNMPKGFGLEIDNILAEFNIPACTTVQQWVESMTYMKSYIQNYVKAINPNLDILCASSAIVDDDQLNTPQAKEFGCDPDYNAYTQKVNPKPEGASGNLRSAGCHIHIGYPNHNINTSVELVKYLDVFVGIPSVLIDTDTNRRKLYGKAGSFRLQRWGVEYRVLSGLFIKDQTLLEWMWNHVKTAIIAFNNGETLPDAKVVQQIINTGDKQKALEVMEQFNIPE